MAMDQNDPRRGAHASAATCYERSGREGRGAGRDPDSGGRGEQVDRPRKDGGPEIEPLRNELRRGGRSGAAKQMTGQAVIAGGERRVAGNAAADAMLRRIVNEDLRIAVGIMAGAVKNRRERQPGREEQKRL